MLQISQVRRGETFMAAPYRATPSSPIMFTSAVRLQRSLTAPLEKKVLICLAERTPRWINSDHLTLLGFAAQLLAGVSYVLARWNQYALLLVIFFLGLNWLGTAWMERWRAHAIG